ncbi:MAG: hypothetical protein HY834_13620 [Devosia nanyangense]|uniref:Uncharacterized protein n=1 Tax=Devosia nanyangense TaxID=1228055 RepID=A0A933L5Q0_9HYPH|nr:hypothetical protein [Devosia nanyangense]
MADKKPRSRDLDWTPLAQTAPGPASSMMPSFSGQPNFSPSVMTAHNYLGAGNPPVELDTAATKEAEPKRSR